MHSGSSKRSTTRRALSPEPGEAEPVGELRSAWSSGIAPHPSHRPGRRVTAHAGDPPSPGSRQGPFKAREVRGEDQPGMATVAAPGHEHPALNQDLSRDLQVLMLTPQALERGR